MNKLLLACASLALLSGATFFPVAAEAKTTVTMWTFLDLSKDGPRETALREMIANFEKANPDIEVKTESQQSFTMTEKFVMSHGTGAAPDVSWVNGENLGLLMKSGVAADLDELFLSKWTPEDWGDILLPGAYDLTKYEGKHVAVPLILISQVQLYRKDLFAAAGIDVNSIKTWDDLTNAAKKLTVVGADGKVSQWGMGLQVSTEKGETTALSTAIIGKQGRLFDESCKPLLDTEAGLQALDLYAGWISKDKIASQEGFAHSLDDVLDRFTSGRVAMASSGISRIANIKAAASWDSAQLGLMAWPSFDGAKSSPQTMSGWFAAISKDSPAKEEAAKWVNYMISAEASKLWADPGIQVPLRKSVFGEPKMQEPQFEWMRDMYKLWQDAAYWPPSECNVARTYTDLNLAVQQVILGQKTPDEALKEAEEATLARQ